LRPNIPLNPGASPAALTLRPLGADPPALMRPDPESRGESRFVALVTGDRTHFGALYGRTIHGVTIHSPRTLAEALRLSSVE